ncbi:NAD+ synthase [Halorutilales archaeon Cl-col2-1]
METETETPSTDTAEAVDTVTDFVTRKVDEAGADGVVVGLSGGIDSTASAAVAVEALGSEKVVGMVMPGEPSEEHNVKDAHSIADSLGIEKKEIQIEPVVDEFVDSVEYEPKKEAVGNVRARSRMVFEYLEANQRNLLVLGTGNRTELLIGYFTKYGDGAVDILPLGGLYKSEVRDVARHLGIDEQFVEKTPTAGLWEGQTDESELGATYDTIDDVLRCLVDRGLSVGETADEVDVDVETVERFEKMYETSVHKRSPPPYPGFGRN